MTDKIKKGDVVKLKSGGPAMTVYDVGNHLGTESAFCTWFENKTKHDDAFPLEILDVVTVSPQGS